MGGQNPPQGLHPAR